ncbi:hypothetical protein A3F66_06825 [candidate division TM6 bacterium RIFCSPHIGHO2_12_FULL_32_22]|nr:MAG: hypothetical protein A3F66_06825 [candidate division TM6 bacterium RIFCSPHIGHO2_12_FULL_32_22]
MNFKFLYLYIISISLFSSEIYRKATLDDLSKLLELIERHAIKDSKKIVILPKRFRRDVLIKNIESGSIFVAEDSDEIIAYKKLFLIKENQKDEILKNELRIGRGEKLFGGSITDKLEFVISDELEIAPGLSIYTGGDFTRDDKRGLGISTKLTDFALNFVSELVRAEIEHHSSLSLVYGLTDSNAGEFPGHHLDRSTSILKSFRKFLESVTNSDIAKILHFRYRAFMPCFDSESTELKPLPDDQSIPGVGCVLTYILKDRYE